MKVAAIADIKARLSEYLKATSKGPVVVTRNGKAVAVLLGVNNDDELERLLLAHSQRLRSFLDAADRRIREGGGVSHEEFWRHVESRNRSQHKTTPKNGAKKRPTG